AETAAMRSNAVACARQSRKSAPSTVIGVAPFTCNATTRSSGAANGSGRRRTASATSSTASAAPSPSARMAMASAEKPGLRTRRRTGRSIRGIVPKCAPRHAFADSDRTIEGNAAAGAPRSMDPIEPCEAVQIALEMDARGALDAARRARLETHVAGCEECRAFRAAQLRTDATLRGVLARETTADDAHAFVAHMRRLRQRGWLFVPFV